MEPRTEVTETRALDKVIRIDEAQVQAHLSEMVRSSVEETLNALLDAEADRLCQAKRYERTAARQDTRMGSYQRELHTKAGEVSLKVPKLRTLPFETAIIERYQRRETSVEEALIEMYLAGVAALSRSGRSVANNANTRAYAGGLYTRLGDMNSRASHADGCVGSF